MLERFKQFEIKNTKVIYGGVHAFSQGIPADNLKGSNSIFNIYRDHGDNDGIPPDDADR